MRTYRDLRTANLSASEAAGSSEATVIEATASEATGSDATGNAVTIGNFDGVHRGHRALIERTRVLAAATSGRAILLTFDPHPAAVLNPDATILRLTTPWERLHLAAQSGADVGVIQPFTRELAGLEAREFVQLLKDHLGMATLVVGPDFALGKGRKGTISVLRELGAELGFAVDVVENVEVDGISVRSSTVRSALQEGNLALANNLLGRNYTLSGEVTLGDQRGRTIGVPTANVQPDPLSVVPANGVYATIARLALPTRTYLFVAATNVGTRPTVDGFHRRVEAHLLDFPPAELPDDLYGHQLTIEFVARLRDEQRFASLEALVAQIHADVAATRLLLPAPPDF